MRDPRWDQIFIPGGKGGIPPPKAGSRHSHLGSWVGLPGSHLYPTWHFTWEGMLVYRLKIKKYHCASMISSANSVFLQELTHVSTGEQMGNVCDSITVTWGQVHLLIQRHQWCLESFVKWTSHWSTAWKTFKTYKESL